MCLVPVALQSADLLAQQASSTYLWHHYLQLLFQQQRQQSSYLGSTSSKASPHAHCRTTQPSRHQNGPFVLCLSRDPCLIYRTWFYLHGGMHRVWPRQMPSSWHWLDSCFTWSAHLQILLWHTYAHKLWLDCQRKDSAAKLFRFVSFASVLCHCVDRWAQRNCHPSRIAAWMVCQLAPFHRTRWRCTPWVPLHLSTPFWI